MRIEKILVPVDFSPTSRAALNHAVVLARKFRAKLSLLHVIEMPGPSAYAFPAESLWPANEHREQAARMLSALLSPEDQDDLGLRTLVEPGVVEQEILSAAQAEGADVVVVGTHGRGLFGRWLIGSVAQHLLRKSSVPILTVCRPLRPPALERILFAADLSETSHPGLHAAMDLAKSAQANLILLHAAGTEGHKKEVTQTAGIDNKKLSEETRKRLDALAAEASARQIQTETVFVEGPAADAILKVAEDTLADLIVLSVERKGLIERTLLGTSAERVIRESHIPVLSVPMTG